MASATNDALRALAEGHRLMSEQLRHMSTTLDHLRVLLEVKTRERQAAVRLQAAARGLLARRLLQTLRGEKSSEEQAAVRLQAAGRGFLVRRMVRTRRMALNMARWQITACRFAHSSSPILPAEFQVWCLPAPTMAMQGQAPKAVQSVPRTAMAVSSVQAPSGLVGCYILLFSAHMKPELFPWDPGGHSCSPNLFHTLVPNLFHIFILNNNGKPRCKRLNPRLRQVGPRQLVGELLRKGGVVSRVVSWAYWAIWAKVL